MFAEIRWLQDQGINVWYDTTGIGPGSEWTDEIATAIQKASTFLYFITESSVASEHCRRELNFAQSEHQHVVAVHLQSTDMPAGLRLSLDNRQAILKHRVPEDDYRTALIAALSSDGERPSQTTTETLRSTSASPKRPAAWLLVAVALLVVAGGVWFWQADVHETPAGAPVTSAVADAPITAIEVMPFDDLSPTQDQQWFAKGMATELIYSQELHMPRVSIVDRHILERTLSEEDYRFTVDNVHTWFIRSTCTCARRENSFGAFTFGRRLHQR